MKLLKKNKILSIAILIQLLLLILCVGDYFLPRFSLDLHGNQILSNGIFQNNVWHTDEDINENGGFFAFTDTITLPRGVYTVNIDYSCTEATNRVLCMGKNTTVNSILYDDITFDPDKNNVSFTLWANHKIDEFQLTTTFGGEGVFEISRIFIAESYASSTLLFLLVFFCSLIIDIAIIAFCYYKTHDISNNTIASIIILALITFFASSPLFAGYLTKGHDLVFHLMRIEGIKDGLLAGQFPVKIQPSPMDGYGYATSVFYGDLFLYIPAFLRIMGLTLQSAYAWYIIFVNIATTLIAYLCIRKIMNSSKIALLGTFLYVLSPYRLANIYGRAAVGEYTAMIFIPLLALGLYQIFTQKTSDKNFSRNWILPVLAYTGIIESHILSCEMVGACTIILCLIFFKKTFEPKRFFLLCKIVLFTILANLGFIVPLADYMLRKYCLISHGVMTSNGIQQSSLTLARFATIFLNGTGMPQARTAFRQYGMSNEMGISAGIALLLCFVLYFYFMIIKNKQKTEHYQFGKFLWFFSFAILFMVSEYFPWDFVDNIATSLIQSLQFPWRLLGIGTFCLALVACCAAELIFKNYSEAIRITYIALAVLLTILTSGWFLDNTMHEKKPFYVYSEYALPMNTSGSNFDEYVPADGNHTVLDHSYTPSSDALVLSNATQKYITIHGTITNSSNATEYLTLPLFYYPGYRVKSDQNLVQCNASKDSLIQLSIPANYVGNFKIDFYEPLHWRIGEFISLFTLLAIVYIFFISKKAL